MTRDHYDAREHTVRFATWCAARAAQRGWAGATNETIVAGLRRSRVVAEFESARGDRAALDEFQQAWVEDLQQVLEPEVATPFGRAAKLVAIFLKATVVCGRLGTASLREHAWPPVDRILVKEAAKVLGKSEPGAAARLRHHVWTRATVEEHMAVLEALRLLTAGKPFWAAERYWVPAA